MGEYVEKDEVLDRLYEEGEWTEAISHTVYAMTAADVVEVVHGRWSKDGDFLICLNCESEMNVKNSLGVVNRKNYCPNCGARMDGE